MAALRVCYFGTYRANYSRNQIMIEGLRRNGVEVIECHERLWYDHNDRIRVASGGWIYPSFWKRLVHVNWRLIQKYRYIKDYDIMVLGYPGQLDVYLARLLTCLRHKPLVLDVLSSLYLMSAERGLTKQNPLNAWFIYGVEKLACLLPDLLIIDTPEYAKWFQKTYNLSPERFRVVFIGADDRLFYPRNTGDREDSLFWVLYYGSFIPQHGIEYILEAARILRNDLDIHFEMIGDGPLRPQAEKFVQLHGLKNVSFAGWIDKRKLPSRIAKADICLGAFGETQQSMITVHNKIYESLAMAKPVITGDSPAVRRLFNIGEHLYVCKRADAYDLARSIKLLKEDPKLRKKIAMRGYKYYKENFTPERLGAQFKKYLFECLEREYL